MCGIFGFWMCAPTPHNVLKEAISRLSHRGPDDSDVWFDSASGVGFAHTRLSIVDLTITGRQPMRSDCGRYVLVFNGEIYNHRDLRARLDGVNWKGNSDTETLLACLVVWGVERTLAAIVGMFAFSLWDGATRRLYVARDRMGEKPVYYGFIGKSFALSSELKALKAIPEFSAEVDRRSVDLMTQRSYVPAPLSIYRNIFKLPPGSWFSLSERELKSLQSPEIREYWRAFDVAIAGISGLRDSLTDQEAVDELEEVLSTSVKSQMMADVPLGAFLSGGVDSSTVVALMQKHSSRPIKTFSIGFDEEGYNEAEFAKNVASHLGTHHQELYVSAAQARDVVPMLPSIYDEPFSDASQIPTFLVSKLAREHVTVSLSGDGGDELFGGYNRYFVAARIQKIMQIFSPALKSIMANGITALSTSQWDALLYSLQKIMPRKIALQRPGEKLYKIVELLRDGNPDSLHRGLTTHWPAGSIVLHEPVRATSLYSKGVIPSSDVIEQMMFLDSVSYLPDDILVKLDRAAMAVSLETRVPLLDHRVYEYSWTLPARFKIRGGQGKWILRQVLYRYIPRSIVERPKMGFGVPIDSWLRGPLREWAEELLDRGRLAREGFFDPDPIRKRWEAHLNGKGNWQYHLWDVLMFQSWLENEARWSALER